MRVRNVMSTPPLTVPPELTMRDLAAFLTEHDVSGVPVVVDGSVVGVVSAADVVERERGPDVEPRTLRSRFRRQRARRAASAATVAEAMKSPPVTVESWMSVYEAAWLMSVYDVNRLPVLDRDELVGVVTRSDLVRYFARTDADIERDVRERLGLLDGPHITVTADHGRVLLEGEVASALELTCLPHLVSGVPGVVDVDCRVTVGAPSPGPAS